MNVGQFQNCLLLITPENMLNHIACLARFERNSSKLICKPNLSKSATKYLADSIVWWIGKLSILLLTNDWDNAETDGPSSMN